LNLYTLWKEVPTLVWRKKLCNGNHEIKVCASIKFDLKQEFVAVY
jgi:hypothetical protein